MSIIAWIFWALLFLVMLGFSLSNTSTATLRFFGSNLEWSAPIVVHLLAFFVAGVIFGLLAVLPAWYRGRRSIASLERQVRKLTAEAKTATAGPSADAAVPVSTNLPTSGLL